MATALGCLPVAIGFAAPALYLLVETFKRLQSAGAVSQHLMHAAFNTVGIALGATALTILCGLVVAWSVRIAPRAPVWLRACSRVATLGYALPGTVLAIGLLYPVMLADHAASWSLEVLGYPTSALILMGSPLVLACAYAIRFLAISIGTIEAGLARIPASIEHAARLLGEGVNGTLRRVHLPLLRPALATAALLVFVDSMKELPATLMLRPMNFDTLATWLYGEAARGSYEEGAIAALGIVLAGLLPVMLLARMQTKYSR
jgi:iron(III) transport system permease protein